MPRLCSLIATFLSTPQKLGGTQKLPGPQTPLKVCQEPDSRYTRLPKGRHVKSPQESFSEFKLFVSCR